MRLLVAAAALLALTALPVRTQAIPVASAPSCSSMTDQTGIVRMPCTSVQALASQWHAKWLPDLASDACRPTRVRIHLTAKRDIEIGGRGAVLAASLFSSSRRVEIERDCRARTL